MTNTAVPHYLRYGDWTVDPGCTRHAISRGALNEAELNGCYNLEILYFGKRIVNAQKIKNPCLTILTTKLGATILTVKKVKSAFKLTFYLTFKLTLELIGDTRGEIRFDTQIGQNPP